MWEITKKAYTYPTQQYIFVYWFSFVCPALIALFLYCLQPPHEILKVRWQDKVPDTEIFHHAGMTSIHTLISKNQLRWAGHVVRKDDNLLPKRIFYGELTTGKRTTGGQFKRYKDTKSLTKEVQHQSRHLRKYCCSEDHLA